MLMRKIPNQYDELPRTMLSHVLVLFLCFIFPCLARDENTCEAPGERCFRVIALIPARAGSKGIKDKNLSKLKNETLLSRTLRIVNRSGKFDSVWVSTDGEAIAEEAVEQGAHVHWRDPETGTDNASTVSVVVDFLKHHKECDIIGVIQCTSPFIREEFLIRALDVMQKDDIDCVFSVIRSHQLRWTENKDGSITPINFNSKKRPRRQDWKGELIENGMFYFAKAELVLREEVLQNNRCKTVEIPKRFSMEVDTIFDLMQARMLLSLFENNTGID